MKTLLVLPVVVIVALQVKKSNDARAWPTVDATITSTTIYTKQRKHKKKGLSLSYRYTVAGVQYMDTDNLPGLYHRSQIQNESQKYPAGKMITIRYNPSNPQDSFLK